jgi:hypothetical protein
MTEGSDKNEEKETKMEDQWMVLLKFSKRW